MGSAADRIRAIAARAGPDAPLHPSWGIPPVPESPDLARVLALPRRVLVPTPELAAAYTNRLKTPTGTMVLKPIQAAALSELSEVGGLFGALGAGEGKTLVALLAPVVLNAIRTVLLVQPALVGQLVERHYPAYSHHFVLPPLRTLADVGSGLPGVYVVSYATLSSKKRSRLLTEINPDLIIFDEAHHAARDSARGRRIRHHFDIRSQTRLVCLSGTMLNNSLTEGYYLADKALGPGSPFPRRRRVAEEWAAVVDPVPDPAPPGALVQLRTRPDQPLRDAFRSRLVETRGVVASGDERLGTSLVINRRDFETPPAVVAALAGLETTWTTPDGVEINDAMTKARHALELSAGFYLRQTWPRGEPLDVREAWLSARREWYREVHHFLTYTPRPGLDSPALLEEAAAAGVRPSAAWTRWAAIQHTARPESEAVVIDDGLFKDAVTWGRANAGVIWYENPVVGESIATLGGFPIYGDGSHAARALIADDHPGTICVSVNAHGEGTDGLQLRYARQLVTCPSASGRVWEQLLARLHRHGQPADEVSCDVYQHTHAYRKALDAAAGRADFVQELLGATPRLKYASWSF